MTNKKLLREIDEWEKENIIDAYAADRLRERYSSGGKTTLMTIFSVLSTVLVGAGVILLFATNWSDMPLSLKTLISFLPMLIGQSVAVFTVIKKYDNTVFRECVSIIYTAGICATLAMISNSFDIVNAAENYILLCSLLTLPVIFILSAVSPLALYYAGILFYAFRGIGDGDLKLFVFFTILMTVGALSIVRIKNEATNDQRRVTFLKWMTTAAFLAYTIKLTDFGDLNGNATYLAFFALLISLYPKDGKYLSPSKVFGVVGIGFMIGIFALGHSWYEADSGYDFFSLLIKTIPALIMCLAAVICTFIAGVDKIKVTALISSFLCVSLSEICYLGIITESTVWTVLANLSLIAFGIVLIIGGTENFDAFTTNLGLVAVGSVVIMRFFDWNLDIFAKGIAFIASGVVLFIFNIRLSKKKKGTSNTHEEVTQ